MALDGHIILAHYVCGEGPQSPQQIEGLERMVMQSEDSDPDTPNPTHPPSEWPKYKTSGPHLAPTWCQGTGKFLKHTVEGNFPFLPHVSTLKMLRILWGIQICMQNTKKTIDP